MPELCVSFCVEMRCNFAIIAPRRQMIIVGGRSSLSVSPCRSSAISCPGYFRLVVRSSLVQAWSSPVPQIPEFLSVCSRRDCQESREVFSVSCFPILIVRCCDPCKQSPHTPMLLPLLQSSIATVLHYKQQCRVLYRIVVSLRQRCPF